METIYIREEDGDSSQELQSPPWVVIGDQNAGYWEGSSKYDRDCALISPWIPLMNGDVERDPGSSSTPELSSESSSESEDDSVEPLQYAKISDKTGVRLDALHTGSLKSGLPKWFPRVKYPQKLPDLGEMLRPRSHHPTSFSNHNTFWDRLFGDNFLSLLNNSPKMLNQLMSQIPNDALPLVRVIASSESSKDTVPKRFQYDISKVEVVSCTKGTEDSETEADEKDGRLGQREMIFRLLEIGTHVPIKNSAPAAGSGARPSGTGTSAALSAGTGSTTQTGSSSVSANLGVNSSRVNGSDNTSLATTPAPEQPVLIYPPLPLVCWYAAHGIRCPGKTKKSPNCRYLIDDHVCPNPYKSGKTKNHHRQPEPCGRCKRAFLNEASAVEHGPIRESNSNPCQQLTGDEIIANQAIARLGVPFVRLPAIKAAVNLQKDTSGWSQEKTGWVEKNIALYIGKSPTTYAKAQEELGLWYAYDRQLFPDEEIPLSPFVDNSGAGGSIGYQRTLELAAINMQNYYQNLPDFRQEEFNIHLQRSLQCFRHAMDIQALELLEVEQVLQKPKTTRKTRKRKKTSNLEVPTQDVHSTGTQSSPQAQTFDSQAPSDENASPSATDFEFDDSEYPGDLFLLSPLMRYNGQQSPVAYQQGFSSLQTAPTYANTTRPEGQSGAPPNSNFRWQ